MSRFPADFNVEAHQAKVATWRAPGAVEARKPRVDYIPIRERKKRGMNGLERAFAQHLEFRKQAGELVWWGFEPIRIRLADGTFYKPDFVTVDANGRTEVWETKGFFREAAKVRIRVAAENFPWPFFIVVKAGGGFRVTRV